MPYPLPLWDGTVANLRPVPEIPTQLMAWVDAYSPPITNR
jgi:hypothetical protein